MKIVVQRVWGQRSPGNVEEAAMSAKAALEPGHDLRKLCGQVQAFARILAGVVKLDRPPGAAQDELPATLPYRPGFQIRNVGSVLGHQAGMRLSRGAASEERNQVESPEML